MPSLGREAQICSAGNVGDELFQRLGPHVLEISLRVRVRPEERKDKAATHRPVEACVLCLVKQLVETQGLAKRKPAPEPIGDLLDDGLVELQRRRREPLNFAVVVLGFAVLRALLKQEREQRVQVIDPR